MNEPENYPSDSEDSDEDFCPNDQISDASEEESDDDIDTAHPDEDSSKKRKATTKVKINKTKKQCTSDAAPDNEIETIRSTRTTTTSTNSKDANKLKEKDELESDDDDDKERSNALWASFLNDTNSPAKSNGTPTKPEQKLNKSPIHSAKNIIKNQSDDKGSDSIKITEILEFAGEEIQITKEVPIDSINTTNKNVAAKQSECKASSCPSKEGPKFNRSLPTMKRTCGSAGGGIGSILGQIGKKTKISVLEKSKLDWDGFKEKEGLKEELQTFNKGKDGYLERQDFLQRTDVRQFEIEKSLRQTKRNN